VSTPPFIEFIEFFDVQGIRTAKLVCKDLPAGFGCRITREETVGLNGETFVGYVRKTKANGKGSIRYVLHGTLESAYEAAVAWARRKVAEARREARVS